MWILLLLLAPGADALNTTWTFSGHFICPIKDEFYYHLVIIEHDMFSFNDVLSNQKPGISKAPHKFSIDAWDNGDVIRNYRIQAQITHECTSHGHRHLYTHEWGDFPQIDYHFNLSRIQFNIQDAGYPTEWGGMGIK